MEGGNQLEFVCGYDCGGVNMVMTEFYKTRTDGVNLYRTFSDAGFTLIRNDGVEYDEAVDVENSGWTYTESANRIVDPSEEITAEEAMSILFGGEVT